MTLDGPGSLKALVRRKGWCINLQAQYSFMAGIAIFQIQCDLTNVGLELVDDVINIVFQV